MSVFEGRSATRQSAGSEARYDVFCSQVFMYVMLDAGAARGREMLFLIDVLQITWDACRAFVGGSNEQRIGDTAYIPGEPRGAVQWCCWPRLQVGLVSFEVFNPPAPKHVSFYGMPARISGARS